MRRLPLVQRDRSSLAARAVVAGALLLSAIIVALLAREWLRSPVPAAHPALAAPRASEPAAPEDRTPEIRGHVLDADGNPAGNAIVRLVSASPPYTVVRDTRCDASGAFSFEHVGPWRLRAVAEHGADGIVTSAVLQAAAGETTEITLVLSAAGAVRGTVVDAQGQPVAGAVISVEGVPWIIPAATSDAAGAFEWTNVPDQASSLVAVARGYRTARATLDPHTDSSPRIVRFVLSAADPVAGDVLDDQGNPIKARIVACENQPSETRITSADDGTFSLPPSAIGCDAVAEEAEHGPSDAIPVVEGHRLALRLKAGGSIEGSVVDERGEGLPSFSLGIESFTPAHGGAFDRAPARPFEDARGAFRWEHLAPGSYVLTAATADRPPSRSTPIDVSAGGATRDVRIVVAQGGTVVGTISDEAHAPLAGVEVRFDQVSSVIGSKAVAQTDATGQYRLTGAPAGPLTLLARKDGFRTKLVSNVRVDSGATVRRDLTLVARDGGAGMELGGIGAVLKEDRGAITLGDVNAGDPAARAGLRPGDRIQSIDGEPTSGMSMADVLQRLRGDPGTSVWVSVVRPESGETVQLAIVRGTIVR